MTILEHDKRGKEVLLPITGKPFSVPPNLFLVGTMNTADRSISLLDAALRRRFAFVELMPDSSLIKGHLSGKLHLGAWLDALNARIRNHLKRDSRNLQVGHAYLMPQQPITSVAQFSRILRDDIIPLLEDYCYDDFSTLRSILGPDLVDSTAARINDAIFSPEREDDLIQAVTFEEMQQLQLIKEAATPIDDNPADDTDDGEPGPAA